MLRKLFVLVCLIIQINARITIDITTGKSSSDVTVNYSGYEKNIISDTEALLFHIDRNNLREAVKKHFHDISPKDVYLKSPTPWGDLYKRYNWEQVSRILKVKSAKLKNASTKSSLILSHDFDNVSNVTIKVNAGISQTVENTITTSWTQGRETTVSQEIEYDLNVIFAKMSGTSSFSYTSSWGKSEEKSESITIGTTSAVEAELKPGQSATAVLTANRKSLEVEVVYVVTLRGNVAVNFYRPYKGHHFYGPSIESVLKSGGLETEINVVETIRMGVFTDASLKVYDKVTGLPL